MNHGAKVGIILDIRKFFTIFNFYGNPGYDKQGVLYQTDFPSENTTYVVRYDFTLGEDITVPANCILEFDRGSISGAYTITGNNTGIHAGLVKIFNTNVTLAGSWNVTEVYPEWFGAKGDGVNEDYTFVQKAIDVSCIIGCKTVALNGIYYCSTTINCTNTREAGTIIRDSLILYGTNTKAAFIFNTGDNPGIETTGSQWLKLKDLTLNVSESNPAKVAIFQGICSILPQTQNQIFENLRIFTPYCPIYNYGAEENTYSQLYIHAGDPIVFTTSCPDIPSYTTLIPTEHSCGMNTWNGENFILHNNLDTTIFTLVNISDISFRDTYVNGGSVVFDIYGSSRGISYNGVFEGGKHFIKINNQLINSAFNVVCGIVEQNYSDIVIISNSGYEISNNKFYFQHAQARELFNREVGRNFDFLGNEIHTDSNSNVGLPPSCMLGSKSKENSVYSNIMFAHYINACNSEYTFNNYLQISTNYTYIGSLNFSYINPAAESQMRGLVKIQYNTTNLPYVGGSSTIDNELSNIELLIIRSYNGGYNLVYNKYEGYCVERHTKQIAYKVSDDRLYVHLFIKTDAFLYTFPKFTITSIPSQFCSLQFDYLTGITTDNITELEQLDMPINAGSTGVRPSKQIVGFRYFDTTLNKPIYWNGSGWVDATGAQV